MGHDQQQQASSSGAVAAILVAVQLVAILGVLAVVGGGLFWVNTARLESRAAAIQERMTVTRTEAQRESVDVQRVPPLPPMQETTFSLAPDAKLNIEVKLDRKGSASFDGEGIGLDELRTQLAKLKHESSNTLSVQINADSECQLKHLIPMLDVCEALGDIDFHIALRKESNSSSGESNAG